MDSMRKQLQKAVQSIMEDYGQGRQIDRTDFWYPDQREIADLLSQLRQILFPGSGQHMQMETVATNLHRQICFVLQTAGERQKNAETIVLSFLRQIPSVRALLQGDLQAAYIGDPAATGHYEILVSYPGFYAVSVYRLAHILHRLEVPMLPRMMTEYAHSVTGIDIHPGAQIGPHFFIDHGTGIVIGETAVIGENVKIYQGVTLGGLSTKGGHNLRGKKRHPTIEDDVTIYANATILGGKTVIGKGSTVGANAFITQSVAGNTSVTVKDQEHRFKLQKK